MAGYSVEYWVDYLVSMMALCSVESMDIKLADLMVLYSATLTVEMKALSKADYLVSKTDDHLDNQ